MIQDRMQFFLSKDHQHHKSRLQEQWTLYQVYQDAQDKQVTQHQLTGQKGRCTDVIENSEVRMSRYLDTSTKTQMAQIMVQYGRSGRSFRVKSVQSSFGRTVMGKAIRESSIKIRLGKKFQIVNAYYHLAANKFERVRGFLELISRFEFEFCRRGNYIFWTIRIFGGFKVQSQQCSRTCACAAACLWPHNSVSNFVVSVTIHDDMFTYKKEEM